MKPLISKENAQNRLETIQRGQVLGVSAFREQISNSAAKRRCSLCPVCLAVTRTANKQNPAERYLVQVKSNLAPMGSAILFEVADKGVNFLDELELSAEDAFSASAPRMGRPIGIWGQRHLWYIRKHKRLRYSELLIRFTH